MMTPEQNKKFVEDLARCIASTKPEHHDELCRAFRIPPALVQKCIEDKK
jgi:hypothetical protein